MDLYRLHHLWDFHIADWIYSDEFPESPHFQSSQSTHETAQFVMGYFKIIQDDDSASDVEVRKLLVLVSLIYVGNNLADP